MPNPPRLVRVLSWNRSAGICKFCRRPIEWAKTERGNPIPLNPHAFILHTERHETTTVRVDVLGPDASHMATCARKPAKKPKAALARSAWAGGRH